MKSSQKLLVVEDNTSINDSICYLLRQQNTVPIETIQAKTLAQSFDYLETLTIDFVVLDLELPDGIGEELIQFLTQLKLEQKTKVIVLTGSEDSFRREQLFQKGVIDYHSKENPVNFLANEIVKTISHFIAHKNTRILIVDDSHLFSSYISMILSNQNFQVEACCDSRLAFERLSKGAFDLLITDLEMPEVSGLDLLRLIRQDDRFLDLPIIGFSGTTNEDLIAKLLKSGVHDFLAKPFKIEALILKINVALNLASRQKSLIKLNQLLEDEVRQKVNEIRQKDQALELENRHAQMGVMISSLIHQWKQPLYSISLATDFIQHHEPLKGDSVEMLQTIKAQVDFLDDTMKHFRDFFKPMKMHIAFSVLEGVETVLNLLAEDVYSEIEITVSGDRSLLILGQPNEFSQALMNLLMNSKDAFEQKRIKNAKVSIDIYEKNKKVWVKVKDNAGGIPADLLPTLFHFYVSSKGDMGTGVGLSMSQMIVEKMQGKIVAKNLEQGACFTMSFPKRVEQ